jgi:hypothetical protein
MIRTTLKRWGRWWLESAALASEYGWMVRAAQAEAADTDAAVASLIADPDLALPADVRAALVSLDPAALPGVLDLLDVVDRVQSEQWRKQETHYRPWACWGIQGGEPDEEYGPFVLDFYPDTPREVLSPKGQVLIDLGLMTGCMCGCRGDMELTPDGRAAASEYRRRLEATT